MLITPKYCKMQQPVVQQDQLGNQQQMSQQMVLCPVRVVYETQILIPPGEQIQPNQTIFINPQNPPPWVQNRLQNQVLYVQQMPNIVSPMQQNIDQNQMYLQQNYAYQIPQMLGPERQMQIQNNFQNINSNIAANPNDRLYMANIGQIQNQMKQQNVQMMNNQIDMQRYLRPQVNQSYRPQVMVNPTQNFQNVSQMNAPNTQVATTPNIANNNINIMQNAMPNPTVSMSNTNVSQIQPRLQPAPNIRPVQQATKVTNTVNDNNTINIAPVAVTVPNRLQQATRIGNMVFEHSVSNVNTIGNPVPRVPQQAYRPIQPRPQYRTNVPNVQTVAPVQNIPYYNQKPNQNQNYNVSNNRKRKSESPDESKKKIIAFETNVQTPNIINIKTSNEIGVNTSPIHKVDDRLQINAPPLKMPDNISQRIVNDTNLPKNNIEIIKTLTNNTSMSIDKIENEKLVRNTVFTQARGRLLNDKEIKVNEVMSVSNEHIINALNANITKQLPNSAINPAAIKEETKFTANLVPTQNNGTQITPNMTIVERNMNMQEFKPANEKIINDGNVINVKKTDIVQSRPAFNIKVEDNNGSIVNNTNLVDSKPTTVTSNNFINTDSKTLMENTELLANNTFSFNTNNISNKMSDNSANSENRNTPKIKVEESTKVSKDIQINSINKDSKTNTSKDANVINENKNESSVENEVHKVIDNSNKSNIAKEQLDSNHVPTEDAEQLNDNNMKIKACKVQLSSNEIQINAGQVKSNDSKLQINDGILHKNDIKSDINNTDCNKVKEEDMVDKIVFKQEVYDQDILTHVLDGYVIQESNVAFPIRKPIKETIIYKQQTEEQKNKNEMKTPVDLPLLPFYYMHLNNHKVKEDNEKTDVKEELKKESNEEKSVEIKEDKKVHPFSKLKQNEVKSWTVDQLIKHLYDQNWNETASILQEHEIDGESLFLVSRAQLIQIGISEEHSDVICEFVHS